MILSAHYYILSALISGGICLFAFWRGRTLWHKPVPGAFSFAFLALFETIWTAAYLLQAYTTALPAALFWNNIQFLGAVLSPVAYFWFGYSYSGRLATVPRGVQRAVLAAAALLLVFIWTDGLHHLFRVGPYLQPGPAVSTLIFQDGPAFFLYPLIGYSLLSAGTYALIHNYLTAPRIYRLQIATVMTGVLIPWVTTLVTWIQMVPVALHDITPLTFAISNGIVAWALYRYGLFDLVPIAYDTLVEYMQDGVLVLDSAQRIMEMNLAAGRVLGQPFAQVLGKPLGTIQPIFEQVLSGTAPDSDPVELALPVGGSTGWYEVRLTQLFDQRQAVKGWLILIRDITARKTAEQQLKQMAITDPLTGIYNRRYFFKTAQAGLEQALRSHLPLSIILFDVDNFKSVNDTLGHIAGDQVLQAVTSRCQETLRLYDVFARYGGEEFIILLPDTQAEQASRVGERLRQRIAEDLVVAQTCLVVTISMGIASLKDHDETVTVDYLVDQADQALYAAKQRGRNQVCNWSELQPWEQPVHQYL